MPKNEDKNKKKTVYDYAEDFSKVLPKVKTLATIGITSLITLGFQKYKKK